MTRPNTAHRVAFAPGRVNLIGDHTDHTGGLALTATLARGTTVRVQLGGPRIELRSTADPDAATVTLPCNPDQVPATAPPWARYVAAVAAVLGCDIGAVGTVDSDLPIGAGLSSSASLEIAVALALIGDTLPRAELARACRRAEHLATGVATGLMDQLTIACSAERHGLLIDFETDACTPVALPETAVFVVVHSGTQRTLADTGYEQRRRDCVEARRLIGPLRDLPSRAIDALPESLRSRARHVVSENRRVREFAHALGEGDLATAGRLMNESHASLRDDLEVSTPALDELVAQLRGGLGCHGARLTGAGFGGCVVALFSRGAALPPGALVAEPVGAARVRDTDA